MDAFETVVASLLRRQGYWTLTSVKVELTKKEKQVIGRPSSPRWELDVVAYSGGRNELRVVECKSYLDSRGVHLAALDGTDKAAARRYKLFCDATLRRVVLRALLRQLEGLGFCRRKPAPVTQLCLAAGRVRGDERLLSRHFERRGWLLWGPEYIRTELGKLQDSGYENSVEAVVAKVLLRDRS